MHGCLGAVYVLATCIGANYTYLPKVYKMVLEADRILPLVGTQIAIGSM